MERMKKEKVHLEGAKVYGPQDYEVVDELKKLKEENKKLKNELELVRKNTRANVETLDNMYGENVDLKKDNEELQKENARLEKELYMAEQTIKDLNLTIRQYEKGFSNGSRLGDDLE